MQAGRGKRVEMGGMLLCAFKALTGAFFLEPCIPVWTWCR